MKAWERWRAIRHRRLQDVLAVAALGTAVALPVILLSVGGGVADHEIYDLEHSGYQVVVSGSGAHGVADAHALASHIAALPNVAAASPILSVAVDAFPPGQGGSPALAEGVEPGPFVATESPEERGLFPGTLPFDPGVDSLAYSNGSYSGTAPLQVMLSSPYAQATGLGTGSTLLLGATSSRSGATPFTVVGTFGVPAALLGPTAAFALVLPLAELQAMVALGNTSGTLLDAADTIQVALAPGVATTTASINAVASEVQALVPYYGVSALTDQAAQLAQSTSVLEGFYLALSSVGLTVGFVFLALVLLRRVESERAQIAIRRAIGVPGGRIAGQWLWSGATLGAAGTGVGVVGGIVTVLALAAYGPGAVQTAAQLAIFDPVTLGALALGLVAVAAAAAGGAARAAVRLNIAGALR